jgi:hypothetical protein
VFLGWEKAVANEKEKLLQVYEAIKNDLNAQKLASV